MLARPRPAARGTRPDGPHVASARSTPGMPLPDACVVAPVPPHQTGFGPLNRATRWSLPHLLIKNHQHRSHSTVLRDVDHAFFRCSPHNTDGAGRNDEAAGHMKALTNH